MNPQMIRCSRLRLSIHTLAVALFAALPLTLPATAAEPIRTFGETLELAGTTALQVKLPVGDLTVEGGRGKGVTVELTVRCPGEKDRDCQHKAEAIFLKSKRNGRWLVLEVDGYPHLGRHNLSVDVHLELPRALPFQADLGVGDVEVAGLTNDVEVDIGVGDARVRHREERARSVELDAGVGEVELYVDGRRITGSGLVGKGLDWSQARGEAHVELDTGVGDLEVILESGKAESGIPE